MKVRSQKSIVAAFAGSLLFAGAAFAQLRVPPKAPEDPPALRVWPIDARKIERSDDEKSLLVSGKTNIKFCVTEGPVKINGWDRNEVRVFIRSGTKFQFRILERDRSTDRPSWVWIYREERTAGTECLMGDEIEMDVPRDASLTVEARSADLMIDSVAKADLKIVEGNAMLRNISNGIRAMTYQGDLLVENSRGAVSLESTTGNIAAMAIEPTQSGDVFRAKTNGGTVAIRDVSYRIIDVNSISGSVSFAGRFSPGGVYSFKTSNGSILMKLSEDVSARLSASFGFGTFRSALPMTITQKTDSPGGKTLIGTFGKGEANISLMTINGTIAIAKQE